MSPVDPQPFRRLLVALIDHDPRQRNTRRLAIDANIIGRDFAGFKDLNKALLNNWIRPTNNTTPRDWRQLAALLKAFDVDENVADILFRVTTRGWNLEALQSQASPSLADLLKFREPILSFRQPTLSAIQDDSLTVVPPAQHGSVSRSDAVELLQPKVTVESTEAAVVDAVVGYIQTDYENRPIVKESPPTVNWGRWWSAAGVAAVLVLVARSSVIWFQARLSK